MAKVRTLQGCLSNCYKDTAFVTNFELTKIPFLKYFHHHLLGY